MIAGSHEPTAADRELLASRVAKIRGGQKTTRAEDSAFRRFQLQVEEVDRWRYYATIPKKHWVALSGRSHAVLKHHAGRYGMPIQGDLIDLAAVVRWLHDFLAKNAAKLAAEVGDPRLSDQLAGDSPALERYREEKFKLTRLDRLEREGTLVARAIAHDCFGRVAGVLRRCGEVLQRQFGPAALRLLNQALEDAQRDVDSVFAADGPCDEWQREHMPDEVQADS